MRRLVADEHTVLLLLAAAIGVAVGLVVTGFFRVIDIVQDVVLQSSQRMAMLPGVVVIAAALALGLGLARLLVRYGAHDSEGENVPDVMFRVTLRGGHIPILPVLAKTVGAALVIGTGGSVGAEGPVIVAGAATASKLGRWLRASPHRLRVLVGCGAAAGLSAAFNAPIAGVIFGIEKILGAAGGMALGPFVVASVLATAVGRAIFGNHPVMATLGVYRFGAPWEFLLLVGLGVLSGVVATAYSRGIWKVHDLLAPRPMWQRLLVGVIVVGALDAVFRANLWGHGHEALNLDALAGQSPGYLLGLSAAKLVATAVTLAAAGLGGVFMPALFVGATLGAGIGALATSAGAGAHVAGALAICGMAGLVSGATFAPLTAMMMVFEMTGDYGSILPLMLTSVLAYLVARRLHPQSVYTEWLARRGIVLTHGADAIVLGRIPVSDCMSAPPVVLPSNASLPDVVARTRGAPSGAFPVVSSEGRLVGMLTGEALRAAREEEALGPLVVAADLATDRATVTPDDSLLTALRRLGTADEDYLAVVDPHDERRLVGIVSRHDLFNTYERVLATEVH